MEDIAVYDTVNLMLSSADVPDVNFLEEVPCYLDEETISTHNYNGIQTIMGKVGGLKVFISSQQIKVKDGSLCKWHLGDNLKTMGRGDTQGAIERLSDTLHLPMDKATVTRIDVAQNIFVKNPVETYLNHLGQLKHATRLQQPSGLYYYKGAETICFYDKIREQRTKGEEIPEMYKDKNFLRYEHRYTKRLASTLNVKEVTAALLYDEAFYISLVRRWRDTYKQIEKLNDITLNFKAMTSKSQLYKMGILSLVESVGGENNMIDQINDARKRGELTSKQACDLRKTIKEACTANVGLTVKSEAIAELNKKIVEAVRYYR